MYVIASCITGLYFRELQTSGEEMKKPKVPFGTIYRRGKKGIFYFENRKMGINPTSLKTSDPDEAMEKVYDRFGYLNYHDELKQHEHILNRYQTSKSKLNRSSSSIKLVDIEGEFIKSLKRSGKKGP